MSYLLVNDENETLEEFLLRYKKYYDYIETVKQAMPQAAYMFAIAPWHYNHNDPRCPHDAWIETIKVREIASGSRSQIRSTEIFIRLLGAFHDGYIEITYEKVVNYSIIQNTPDGHGDWLLDEIRLSEEKIVIHEIIFVGGRCMIVCEDIIYQWKPFSKIDSA